MSFAEYKMCMLCRRRCGADRTGKASGYCGMSDKVKVARASLHMWEEPIISGESGSGTIFFSGCSLGCVFCQNYKISNGRLGREITEEELSQIMLKLQNMGANNINFVTPTHYAPSIVKAVKTARDGGLIIPTVYNTGTYDSPGTLKMLSGSIDIYLPDFKYYRKQTAQKLSFAPDYTECAKEAIDEMMLQQPKPVIENGLMKKGVIVRIMLLPGHVAEAKLSLKYIYDRYKDDVYISLLNQYTPVQKLPSPLNRRVLHSEYDEFVDYALKIGVSNAFIQEWGTADESFIPDFTDFDFL